MIKIKKNISAEKKSDTLGDKKMGNVISDVILINVTFIAISNNWYY